MEENPANNARIQQLLQEQNQLLQKLVEKETQKQKRRTISDVISFIKWGIVVISIIWFVMQTKMFLEGLFASVTPDLSGLEAKFESFSGENDEIFENAEQTLNNFLQKFEF